MGAKFGMNAKLYYGASGATASNELSNCKDVTLDLETGEADVTVRANEGWRATAATLKDASIEFEMIVDSEDAGYSFLADAFFSNTPIAILCLDAENGEGLDADVMITRFSRNEPLEEAITVSVTLKPTYSGRAPAWQSAA